MLILDLELDVKQVIFAQYSSATAVSESFRLKAMDRKGCNCCGLLRRLFIIGQMRVKGFLGSRLALLFLHRFFENLSKYAVERAFALAVMLSSLQNCLFFGLYVLHDGE